MFENTRLAVLIQAVATAPSSDPLEPRVSEEIQNRLISAIRGIPEALLRNARAFRDFGVVGVQWDSRGDDFVVALAGPTHEGVAVHIVGEYRWHGYLVSGEDVPPVFVQALRRIADLHAENPPVCN